MMNALSAASPHTVPLRVLIVDDDRDDYYLTSQMLSDAALPNIQVQWEATYAAALNQMLCEPFDIVLIDYRLGEQTGAELLRTAHELGFVTPAILLTGTGSPEIDREAEASGAAAFIPKQDLTASLLDRAIRYAMTNARATDLIRGEGALGHIVLDSLTTHVAVVAMDGEIIAVNFAWRRFGVVNGLALSATGLGVNYLEICDGAARAGNHDALVVADGLRGVLGGTREDFSHEYACHSPQEQRWFVVRVTRPDGEQPGRAILAHENVTERVLAERAVRDIEIRFQTLVEQMPAMIAVSAIGAASPSSYVSPQVAAIFGYTPEEWLADPDLWRDSIHPDDRERMLAEHHGAYSTGHPTEMDYRIIRRDGQTAWIHSTGLLARDEVGQPLYWQAMISDVTEHTQAEGRRQLLANVSSTLAESLDLPTTLQQVARFAVPGFADWCTVNLFDDDGTLRRLAVIHADPAKADGAARLMQLPINMNRSFGLPLAIRTRTAVLYSDLPIQEHSSVPLPEYRKVQRALGMVSVLNAPLIARGHVLGGMVFVYGDSGRHYVDGDIQFAEEIARRAAIAIDNVQLYRAARLAEADFRTLVEQVPGVMYRRTLDSASAELYLSPQLEQLLGYTVAEWQASAKFRHDVVHADDRAWYQSEVDRTEATHEFFDIEYRYLAKSGEFIWVRNTARVVHDEVGTPLFWQGFITDISERKQAELVLQQREARFRSLVQHATDMVCIVDAWGNFVYQSPSVEQQLGYTPADFIGTSALAWLHPDEQPAMQEFLVDIAAQPEAVRPYTYRCRHADGSLRWIEASFTNLLAEPAIQGIVINARDITERRRLEHEVSHQALHDALTGLPNRILMQDRIEHALLRARRDGTSVAVLFVDLDNFKNVNDSFGHMAGDQLLVIVAQRLRGHVRESDTIARSGGDEFAIVLASGERADAAVEIAGRICAAFADPIDVGGNEVFVQTSVGIAVSRDGEITPDDLLRQADEAMYRAKTQGKNQYALYDRLAHTAMLERVALESDLHGAIARDELILFYQPKVALATGQTVGMEALVRWQHPGRGLVSPDEFIPIAETTGLIVPLGLWVLREACRTATLFANGLGVSVNVSARQFVQTDLEEQVHIVLEETGLNPALLMLELTESVVMSDAEEAVTRLYALKALGIQLAIDDFGTGYSSLAYLKRFPIDVIKIDRSFVSGLERSAEDGAIVSSIIGLAHILGMTVVAEGIETPEQVELLQKMGCDRGQGFYFGRPAPFGDTSDPTDIVALSCVIAAATP